MSFYEGRPKASGYMDVHEPTSAGAHPAPPKAVDPGAWLSHRKNRPVDRLLPIAKRWQEALPATLRPQALIAYYPRIANLLALQWNDPDALAAYLDELLVDRRGDRQGFPPPVQSELVRLRNHGFGAPARGSPG
jgi:hypothetical protein